MGLHESVVGVPPGRTGRIALRREDTFRIRRLQHFGSRHRALSPRWRGLGGKVRRGSLDALLYELCSRKGCGVSSIQNQGMGERRPSHEGSSGRDQVCGLESCTAVPRSYVTELTGRGGSNDSALSGLGGQIEQPRSAKHTRGARGWRSDSHTEDDQRPLRAVTDPSHAARRNGSLSHQSE